MHWLVDGDENTKLFHASASARRKANNISFWLNDAGEHVNDHEGMCNIVKDYFTDLFAGEVVNNKPVQVSSSGVIS